MKIKVTMILDFGDKVFDSYGDVDRILSDTIINTLSLPDGDEDDAGTGGWGALQLSWDAYKDE